MPYRLDILDPPPDALDVLIALGALDVEPAAGSLAAILPDSVSAATAAGRLGIAVTRVAVSGAVARDGGSVWLLRPPHVAIGGLRFAPPGAPAPAAAIRLADSSAFGTGCHPTTALCLAMLSDMLPDSSIHRMLDVGTGSGILALAALRLGVPRVVALDTDETAVRTAAGNARLNALTGRISFVAGGPEAVSGLWPLIAANILAAGLIDLAPALVRRAASRGRLILSGIPVALETDVSKTYTRLGLRHVSTETQGGWAAVLLATSW